MLEISKIENCDKVIFLSISLNGNSINCGLLENIVKLESIIFGVYCKSIVTVEILLSNPELNRALYLNESETGLRELSFCV